MERPIKALVITDTVSSGDSIAIITKSLNKAGVKCDVASLGSYKEDDYVIGSFENRIGGKFFYGEWGEPSIYKKEHLSGVKKDRKNAFASTLDKESLKSDVWLVLEDGAEMDVSKQESISMAREDAKKLGDELIEWYRRQEW